MCFRSAAKTFLTLPLVLAISAFVLTASAFATHIRPVGATPMRVPLVPAHEPCDDGYTRLHGPPVGYHACTPPEPESDWLTVGTPDANGLPAKSAGFVKVTSILGDPSTPENEADVRVEFQLTDVRESADLSDYGGFLLATADWQITDHYNGPAQNETATSWESWDAEGPPYFWAWIPCEETDDPAVGSTCEIDVTINQMMPGAIREGKRMVIEKLEGFEIWDGGTDGDPFGGPTNDETVFAREGIFIP